MGPNGSGKTTLLRTIGGLLPYEGTISLFGQDAKKVSSRARAQRMAFVRQTLSLVFDLTLEEFVLLGRSPHKSWLAPYSDADRQLARKALTTVDMEPFSGRSMLNLSGGEQQRAVLAQALVQEAELLLLDEPTSHLDVHHRFEFMEHIRSLVAGGRTVLAVFHDLELAARYSDRLLVMSSGRLAASGPPKEVLTEEILAQVFRMRARIDPLGEGNLRIRYLEKIRETAQAVSH